jgi:hypothetical protein
LRKVPEVIAIDGKMTPKQIVDNLRLKFGVDVNEKAARRAKATLLKKDTTSQREEYHRLPAYIDELREANPGAHLKLNLDPDTGAFRSLFICPQTSREAFRHCRKIVAMDGTFTKNAVQQCILIAVTVDADNHAVRLAKQHQDGNTRDQRAGCHNHE